MNSKTFVCQVIPRRPPSFNDKASNEYAKILNDYLLTTPDFPRVLLLLET